EGPDWNYPLHLGVTEAGDGEDGRIKSAIGIGSLLADGLGDTIRVSLTEDSVHEIPVAQALVAPYNAVNAASAENGTNHESQITNHLTLLTSHVSPLTSHFDTLPFDPFHFEKRETEKIQVNGVDLGGEELIRVAISQGNFEKIAHKVDKMGDFKPEIVVEESGVVAVDPRDEAKIAEINSKSQPCLVTVADHIGLPTITAFRLLAAQLQARHPILLKDTLVPSSDGQKDFVQTLLESATNLGALICDGIGDAILVQGEQAPGQSLRLSYNILQAAGSRIFKTDYVACPSCGRTLFNLQTTTAKIKASTTHLKGVKIAIMGCIVNGPGEMADADFGYVGGAPGKVNLYVGKTAVKFNIPEAEAVDRLVDLIKEHGRWVEKPVQAAEVMA
ncbi:MAG: flavodoxin-dependent (E)-4-hydroxy-3-methylbut-2-enyl-diphosphate synthase, partial [Chthoniobacterales bacterium]